MKLLPLSLFACIALSLASCKKETTPVDQKKDSIASVDSIAPEPEFHKDLYGIYTGDFQGKQSRYDDEYGQYYEYDNKKISLKINRITKDSVYGHSIVNGNQRPFRGVFNENTTSFVLDEPGSDKTDGRFEVKIKGDSLTGNWAAYKKKGLTYPDKELRLIKKNFVYNPNFMLEEESELIDWENPKEFTKKYTDDETGKVESFKAEKNRIASDAVLK